MSVAATSNQTFCQSFNRQNEVRTMENVPSFIILTQSISNGCLLNYSREKSWRIALISKKRKNIPSHKINKFNLTLFFFVVPLRRIIGSCSYLILAVQKKRSVRATWSMTMVLQKPKYVIRFIYQPLLDFADFLCLFFWFVAIESIVNMRRKPFDIKMENELQLNEMFQ